MKIAAAESQVLEALWRKAPLTFEEIVAEVGPVNGWASGTVRTLVTRGLVEEAGQDPETTAVLYRTTSYFLERIGIGSLAELPDLAPYLPEMADLDDPDERTEQLAPEQSAAEQPHDVDPPPA